MPPHSSGLDVVVVIYPVRNLGPGGYKVVWFSDRSWDIRIIRMAQSGRQTRGPEGVRANPAGSLGWDLGNGNNGDDMSENDDDGIVSSYFKCHLCDEVG